MALDFDLSRDFFNDDRLASYEPYTSTATAAREEKSAAKFWNELAWEAEAGLQTRTDALGQVWVFPLGTNESHPDAYIRMGTAAQRETVYVPRVGQVGID